LDREDQPAALNTRRTNTELLEDLNRDGQDPQDGSNLLDPVHPVHPCSTPEPSDRPKRLERREVAEVMAAHRAAGRRIVFTNGCFDLLHVGHVRYLQQARALGDLLVVGVNTDASVRRLKGASRPLVPEAERAELLAALECVDHVVPFAEETPEALIAEVRPDLHVKGGDYRAEELPETRLVRALGGEVVILPFTPDRSTTGLMQSIRGAHDGNHRRGAEEE